VQLEKNIKEFSNAWATLFACQNIADDKVDLANKLFPVSNLWPVDLSRVEYDLIPGPLVLAYLASAIRLSEAPSTTDLAMTVQTDDGKVSSLVVVPMALDMVDLYVFSLCSTDAARMVRLEQDLISN